MSINKLINIAAGTCAKYFKEVVKHVKVLR